MDSLLRLIFVFCLLALFLSVSAVAQDESIEEPAEGAVEESADESDEGAVGASEEEPEETGPILDEAKNIADVRAYIQYHIEKHDWNEYDPKKSSAVLAEIEMPAYDKLLEIVETSDNLMEKWHAYRMKYYSLVHFLKAEGEEAEQILDIFLEELESRENIEPMIAQIIHEGRFFQFQHRIQQAEVSMEVFNEFKTELKTWIDLNADTMPAVARLGLNIADKNNIPAEQFVKEISAYIKSEECPLSAPDKIRATATFEAVLRTTIGNDPKLYGKTLTYRNLNWDALRGKYVVIHFTSTWCVPSHEDLPMFREAREKYLDRGFEIVSIYVMEFGTEAEQIAKVRDHAEKKEKLPWLAVSETLTTTSKQQSQSEYYALQGIPMTLLVDTDGKIIMTEASGERLKDKLKEIFRF